MIALAPDTPLTLPWTVAEAVPETLRPAGLWSWLTESGSLTRRLRSEFGGDLQIARRAERLEALRAADAQRMGLTPPQQAWLREVVLGTAATPLVHAISVIPEVTLGAHRWLAELGDRPLGEALFAVEGVSREPLEVALLADAHPLANRALRATGARLATLWVRRSVVRLAGHPLLIHECFVGPLP